MEGGGSKERTGPPDLLQTSAADSYRMCRTQGRANTGLTWPQDQPQVTRSSAMKSHSPSPIHLGATILAKEDGGAGILKEHFKSKMSI